MRLIDVIQGLSTRNVMGSTEREVQGISADSREIGKDWVFVAIPGTGVDGHHFIPKSLSAGASVIICEDLPENTEATICYIQVDDSREAIAQLAANWYGNPSKEIKLVGVTGTNGKTTIATLLYKVHTGLGYKAGILSTIEVVINETSYPATHTTPDPVQINKWMRLMVDSGCEYCFMEVSSHAASQKRIHALDFDGGIFTNLTHDHLDYHKDFRDYLEAKKSFFDGLKAEAFALTNKDEKNGMVMLQNTAASKHTYSLGMLADYHAKILEPHFDGMEMKINEQEIWVQLTGRFNASNIIAVYGATQLLGHENEQVLQMISGLKAVEGRFDVIKGASGLIAIVDYAHTDDALKNVLETIHEVNLEGREIITVVGAGGDRDKSKRPKMGAVVAAMSSKVILTSDNPRSEDPAVIMDEMEKGIESERVLSVLKIQDREEAIKTACMLAGNKGIVLVAGKGHEKYQEIMGNKTHFDDKEILRKYIK